MTFAICFDFPEGGDPWFASLRGSGLDVPAWGWTRSLRAAKWFDNEEDAERVLKNAYGTESRKWGAVVEVAA